MSLCQHSSTKLKTEDWQFLFDCPKFSYIPGWAVEFLQLTIFVFFLYSFPTCTAQCSRWNWLTRREERWRTETSLKTFALHIANIIIKVIKESVNIHDNNTYHCWKAEDFLAIWSEFFLFLSTDLYYSPYIRLLPSPLLFYYCRLWWTIQKIYKIEKCRDQDKNAQLVSSVPKQYVIQSDVVSLKYEITQICLHICKKMISGGIEPPTFCVLDRCDNHYTTRPLRVSWKFEIATFYVPICQRTADTCTEFHTRKSLLLGVESRSLRSKTTEMF